MGPIRHGVADLDGIPRHVIEAFSQRRQQIRRRLVELGHHSARAAQAATLATRPAKPAGVTAETLRCRWQQQAEALGLTGPTLAGLLGNARPPPLTGRDVQRLSVHLASADGLTRHASTFTRHDVIQAICQQLPAGGRVEDIERLAERFLSNQAVVCQLTPEHAASADAARFSTHELLGIEAQVVAAGPRRRHDRAGVVPPSAVAGALAAHDAAQTLRATLGLGARHLEADQVALVARLVTSGQGIELVNAKAGAGKTFALGVARLAWERGGYRVIGATLAAQAARQLTDEAGIDSRTIARLLWELADPRAPGFHPRTVLVLDEASMVGTRQLAWILWHAEQASTKVVLVGDTHQLPEIEAGGAFRGLWQRLGGIELACNRRQQQPWERDALDLVRAGHAVAAVSRYHQHGRLVVRQRAHALRRQLVADWWAAMQRHHEQPPVMLAARRADVAQLNRSARELLAAAGRLGPDTLQVGGEQFAAGDRVVCLRNAGRLGVLNGTRGTVTAVDHAGGGLLVRTDDGRDLVLPRWYLHGPSHRGRPQLAHGYAITGHKAQGLTTDRCFVLAGDELYKEWGYVAMSRGRLDNRLYALVGDPPLADELDLLPAATPDPIPAIGAALARSHAERLALDHQHPAGSQADTTPAHRSRADRQPVIPPTAQRVRLQHAYQQALLALTEVREALARGGLRRRQRRALTRTLTTAERTASSLEHQLAALDQQHARSDPQGSARQLERDPPRYLLAELGGRPRTATARALWHAAADDIDRYRARHAITDPAHALGPLVDDPRRHAERQHLQHALDQTATQIAAIETAGGTDSQELDC